MIPLEEAQRHVLDLCEQTRATTLDLDEALGCITAAPIVAREAVPGFDNTAMDGYAVRAIDTANPPVHLRVVDELPAGQAPATSVAKGEAIQIMTGAAIPIGADAIVNVEETPRVDEEVVVNITVNPGQFIRRAGSDIQAGSTVFEVGTELQAAHLGVLASIGERSITVIPRLRVGIVSSGDELVSDGSPLRPGQIRESNKDMLRALVAQANCEAIDLGVAHDDEADLRAIFEAGAMGCDALITSGGVSMGEYDLVKVVLDKLGTMRWMQIAIQPAKPFAFGTIARDDRVVPVFALPGNPVSSLVSFELLARPALRKMMGHRNIERPHVLAVADEGLPRRSGDGKTQWQRVRGEFAPDGRLHVRTTGKQGSHQLANSAEANALARIPDGEGIAIGGEVDVLLLI